MAAHSADRIRSKRSRQDPLEAQQLLGIGLVGQGHPVGQIHELQLGRCDTLGAQQDQGVELQLEQRLGLVRQARGAAGLVVDDVQFALGRAVEAVHDPAQGRPVGQLGLDEGLARLRFETARILEPEVDAHQLADLGEEVVEVRVRDQPLDLGPGLAHPGPRGGDERGGGFDIPLGGGQAEQGLEHRVHHGAAHGGLRGRLGYLIDDPQPILQRTLLEIDCPRRGQRGPARAEPLCLRGSDHVNRHTWQAKRRHRQGACHSRQQ
ncbi:hypothetical protein GCM10010198_53880 [Nocardia seriolae]|nr:hypothetical protein NSERKGN1266_44670 [Nocardia seriolae]BEK96269.1 hypothetical protein NSER024013_41750 [Nocardia seriolae]GEM22308.1 hypothetical protein NS2_05470 [Nocardia seriolae NBRC 15557]